MQHVTTTRVVLVAVPPRSKLRWAFSAVSTHCRWCRRWCRRRMALLLVTRAVAVRNSAWFILWTGCIAGIINFVVFVTLAHFLIMVHLTFQIKDLYLEILDELLNRINWCRIYPPSKTTVFWSIGRLQKNFAEKIARRSVGAGRRQRGGQPQAAQQRGGRPFHKDDEDDDTSNAAASQDEPCTIPYCNCPCQKKKCSAPPAPPPAPPAMGGYCGEGSTQFATWGAATRTI